MRIAQARAAAPGEAPETAEPAETATDASAARPSARTGLAGTAASMAPALAGLLARELAEPLAGRLVRPERLVGGELLVGGDLLRDRTHLREDGLAVARVAEQRLDPRLPAFAVVGGHLVLEQKLAEQDADADVGERAEREDLVRRVDEAADLLVLVLDAADDRADR